MCIKINKIGKQEVGIWWVQKRFPRYGVPIWSLRSNNIRFLPSIVAEKNATKNEHICSMCIKSNKVSKQEVWIWWVQKRFPRYGVPITGIVTVCVFVCHVSSYHPFYFDFHSARIIFDVSSGFYLWNVNRTTTWHLQKMLKLAFKDVSTENSEHTYWTILFVMLKMYFIYKVAI
jgi:hypothetical protein